MNIEQLLLIAREFCQAHRVRVTDFAALAAAAAASTATVEGIAVHGSRTAAAESLEKILRAVPALSGKNEEFARFCAEVYLSVAEVM
ncbi:MULTISPECIES: cell filamentation protein Fic [unclassified Corynebacterium]|uniref:cell filamentation protein Fic n=1 Tax=unclassified Corynebacterium TaxID=2624378 RepID=UPI0008A41232|nr:MULTISPECIES: cell filamentation protein Fic [unclassified Corynebacterium]OFN77101.1 cell filamentation protein Fic [Corynebacterium sp. HMSC074E01]OFP63739.1 cell filamentation protein Fic [Corynebacterium sp. HMSC074C01]OHO63284.1 cell filamentation protein Fic [Corynebacterium sp. HMSC036D02]